MNNVNVLHDGPREMKQRIRLGSNELSTQRWTKKREREINKSLERRNGRREKEKNEAFTNTVKEKKHGERERERALNRRRREEWANFRETIIS